MGRCVVLLLLVLLSLAFAPAPLPRRERQSRQDPTDVAGTWEFVRWEVDGSRSARAERKWRAELTREKFTLIDKDSAGREEHPMRLDPGASPPAFVWHDNGVVDFVGSYRLRGDDLTILLRHGGRTEDRPTDVDSAPAAGHRFVLRRIRRGR